MNKQTTVEALQVIAEATKEGFEKTYIEVRFLGNTAHIYATDITSAAIDALIDNGFYVRVEEGLAEIFNKHEEA